MSNPSHLSSETIDLLLLSALSADLAHQAHQHLEGCPQCSKRWQQLNEDKQRFDQFVFPRTIANIEARTAQRGFFEWLEPRRWMAFAGVAAAVLLTTAAVVRRSGSEEPYFGIKGSTPSLELYAQRNTTTFQVRPGAVLRPHDRVRFVVNPAGATHVLIASRDGAGTFSVYHPFGARQSEALPAPTRARHELKTTVELDDTVGAERLVAVFSNEPISAEVVKGAMERGDQITVDGAQVVTWVIQKEAP